MTRILPWIGNAPSIGKSSTVTTWTWLPAIEPSFRQNTIFTKRSCKHRARRATNTPGSNTYQGKVMLRQSILSILHVSISITRLGWRHWEENRLRLQPGSVPSSTRAGVPSVRRLRRSRPRSSLTRRPTRFISAARAPVCSRARTAAPRLWRSTTAWVEASSQAWQSRPIIRTWFTPTRNSTASTGPAMAGLIGRAAIGVASPCWRIRPHPNTLYSASGPFDYVQKSTDGGKTWSLCRRRAGRGFDNCPGDGPPQQQRAVCGRQRAGPVQINGWCRTWKPITTNTNITALLVDPDNSRVVYAGTDGHGVYKSTNGGRSFARVGSPKVATSSRLPRAVKPCLPEPPPRVSPRVSMAAGPGKTGCHGGHWQRTQRR